MNSGGMHTASLHFTGYININIFKVAFKQIKTVSEIGLGDLLDIALKVIKKCLL